MFLISACDLRLLFLAAGIPPKTRGRYEKKLQLGVRLKMYYDWFIVDANPLSPRKVGVCIFDEE